MTGKTKQLAHVHVIDHPLVQDSLTHLRDKTTQVQQFRWHSDRICQQLFFEATRSIAVRAVTIETPITQTTAIKLDEEVILVPVLRSGVCMLFGALQLLPKAKVGFAGIQRDEERVVAGQCFWKFPQVKHSSVVIITDPMIATGGSILHILRELKTYQPKEFRIVCVIATPKGIKAIHAEFPGVAIYAASVDAQINAKKFIMPGLGDYGDRYYGTE